MSAGCDVLLFEQKAFCDKMKSSSNASQHFVLEGAIHGFMTYGREFVGLHLSIKEDVNFSKTPKTLRQIELELDFNKENRDRETPLFYASEYVDAIAQVLCEAGARESE